MFGRREENGGSRSGKKKEVRRIMERKRKMKKMKMNRRWVPAKNRSTKNR